MGPLPALALAAGGTGASILGAQERADEQRAILNRQFERTQANQKRATAQTMDEAQTMGGAQRLADMQAAAGTSAAQTMSDLKGAGADVIDTAGGSGGMQSQALRDATAERQATEGERMSQIAQQLGAVRSVGKVQTAGAQRRAALAEALGSMWNSDRAHAQAAQLDADAVDEPWYGQLGKLASTVGTVAMMAPMAGAAGGAGAMGVDTTAKLGAGNGGAALGWGRAPVRFGMWG